MLMFKIWKYYLIDKKILNILSYSNLDEKGNPRLYRLSVPFSDYDLKKKYE